LARIRRTEQRRPASLPCSRRVPLSKVCQRRPPDRCMQWTGQKER
jgi:hypothetical protein